MTEDEYSRVENGQLAGEALLFMRSRPKNPDGTMGFIIRWGMPEWSAWEWYFKANGMRRQLAFMRSRHEAGYMVPCANPAVFDKTFRPQMKEAAE